MKNDILRLASKALGYFIIYPAIHLRVVAYAAIGASQTGNTPNQHLVTSTYITSAAGSFGTRGTPLRAREGFSPQDRFSLGKAKGEQLGQ
jgi:hypothetical protein